MRRPARCALSVSMAVGLACGSSEPAAHRAAETLELPPALASDRGLTFARRATASSPVLLLVRRVEGAGVEAVAVPETNDPIEALATLGRDALRARLALGPFARVPLEELGLPLDLGESHVAAGANFREHGDEVGVADPFLFPKRVVPTGWSSPVPAAARLDYEVELCFVTLRSVADADRLGDAFGVLLCNDFTDRWALVKGMLRPGPMGTRGFADAKGRPGFLPVGPLLVVPEDLEAFLADTTLELWVDGELRQQAPATDMIWPLRELVARSLADEARYSFAGGEVPLVAGDALPPRTLVLSGTPGGVAFAFGNLWRASAYLRAGALVEARATGLGVLRNRVTGDAAE